MPTATIDHLEVSYVTRGSGPALLMLAPGGFDATMEKWATAGVWKGMQPLDSLSREFTIIAYDRRESGASGGRGRAALVAALCRAGQAPARSSRDQKGVRPRWVHGLLGRGGVRRALPRGHAGARAALARRRLSLEAERHRSAGGTSGSLARTGWPVWSSAPTPASRSGRTPRPVPGRPSSCATHISPTSAGLDHPRRRSAHATSGAHYLRELLPQPEFWTLMPPEQTPERVRDRIREFGRAHR
jgi:hypothetical protein